MQHWQAAYNTLRLDFPPILKTRKVSMKPPWIICVTRKTRNGMADTDLYMVEIHKLKTEAHGDSRARKRRDKQEQKNICGNEKWNNSYTLGELSDKPQVQLDDFLSLLHNIKPVNITTARNGRRRGSRESGRICLLILDLITRDV